MTIGPKPKKLSVVEPQGLAVFTATKKPLLKAF